MNIREWDPDVDSGAPQNNTKTEENLNVQGATCSS